MAGAVSPGQKLSPNLNFFAIVRHGGDTWGANGGGAVAIGGGATDQTGYVKPVAATASDGETATNYIPSTQLSPVGTVLGQENNCALSGQTQDSALSVGGSNAG
jgi:hypothetical protein